MELWDRIIVKESDDAVGQRGSTGRQLTRKSLRHVNNVSFLIHVELNVLRIPKTLPSFAVEIHLTNVFICHMKAYAKHSFLKK